MKTNAFYPVVRARMHAPMGPFITRPVIRQWPVMPSTNLKITSPSTNVARLENGYQIEMAIPGVPKDQIQIQVVEGQLIISATNPNQDKETQYVRREFDYSAFTKSYNLPKNADVEKLTANFDQGILTIVIPDKQPDTRKIEIQ